MRRNTLVRVGMWLTKTAPDANSLNLWAHWGMELDKYYLRSCELHFVRAGELIIRKKEGAINGTQKLDGFFKSVI